MKKYKVIIGQLHDRTINLLLLLFEELPDFEVVACVRKGEEFVEQTLLLHPDIAIVDISIPEFDGITIIKECHILLPKLKTIFLTRSTSFAVKAFEVSAVDYIIIPFKKSRLILALEKVKKAILLESTASTDNNISVLTVREGSFYYFIDKKDILYLEKVGHVVFIHTVEKIYKTQETLAYYNDSIGDNFMKSHRSYIINLQKLKYIERSGKTFLANFYNYDKPAFVSKYQLEKVINRINQP
ncbi:LytR/AlgR family response regulator transcription factor [Aquibacillus rhizosphaerae]|uniref:LytTR family DNA-binding domain-containing protein n=1 Tax=Aquibacillus rhizosphaerae TaxID=3051431 RepID=A0ABT7LAM6_9BACI|nr:LytTR family DNA-binding domain-containing protein [Aquibacillus sp. LR5S19]MDL4842255.1 LytTR family DNA-binding domain-containing protein [Aquibacillus sp. LR5S19]